jgi:hypothetical protein
MGYELFLNFIKEHFGEALTRSNTIVDFWCSISDANMKVHKLCFNPVKQCAEHDSYIQIGGYPATIQGEDDMDLIAAVDTCIGDGGIFYAFLEDNNLHASTQMY